MRMAMVLATLFACSKPIPVQTLDVQPAPLSVEVADAANGRYLVESVVACGECHGADLAGKYVVDAFPVGRLTAPNLTTLDYDAQDWVRAIRHGVTPGGHKILMMASHDYAALTRSDLADMIAHLEGLAPVERALEPSKLGPVGSSLVRSGRWAFHADEIDHAAPLPMAPEEQTEVKRGAYLARIGSCMSCHAEGVGRGFGPGQPRSANLTPHADGLAGWTRDDFATAVRQGRRPDGESLDPFMPYPFYAAMREADVNALWAYFRSLPPQPSP